jgi:predicted amidophosphoribosyltransferase
MIVGALLVAYSNRSLYRSKANSIAVLKSVFCRHCGKKTVTGEYCSACGKSSQSSSTTMKICRGCSSPMSEDSLYCANCGNGFR